MRFREVQLSTVIFPLVILAGVCWAIAASFGPVKLLGAALAMIGVMAISTERRKRRNADDRS